MVTVLVVDGVAVVAMVVVVLVSLLLGGWWWWLFIGIIGMWKKHNKWVNLVSSSSTFSSVFCFSGPCRNI